MCVVPMKMAFPLMLQMKKVLPHDGHGDVPAQAGGDGGLGEGGADVVDVAEEGRAVLLDAAHHDVGPQGVEAGAAVVEQPGEPAVEGGGPHVGAVLADVGVDLLLLQDLADELEVEICFRSKSIYF